MSDSWKILLIEELTVEEEAILERNLVWVLGSPRSGTTWLATQLLSYNTRILNEPGISEHLGVAVWAITDKIVRNVDMRKKHENYFFSDSYKETWLHFLRKLILNRIHAQFLDLDSKIIIKEPMRMWASDILSECLPNSKIIFLIRDGRDIVDSQVDARKSDSSWMVKGGLSTLQENEINEFIKYQSERYTKLAENLLDSYEKHSKDNGIFIKYEDLLSNTYEELKKLYEFAQIPISKNEINDLIRKYDFENIPKSEKGSEKFYRFATPGKWKENFSEHQKQEMLFIMENVLTKLNYKLE